MNHTSGIPRYIFQSEFLNALKEDPEKDWLPRECVALILDKTPLHETGNGWGYSDTNYLLLGMAIEKVTGKTFYDLAKERLLNPLGLKNTIPSTQSKLPSLCQGHIGSQNPFGLPPKTVKNGRYCLNPKFEWCGGGFVSTVDDLAVWLRALHGGDMLKNEQYEQLIRAVDFRTGLDTDGDGYGLGTFVWQTDSGKFLGHAGMMPGYLTQIEYSCEHKFAIALQTNSDETMGQKHHGMVQQLASSVVKYLESN